MKGCRRLIPAIGVVLVLMGDACTGLAQPASGAGTLAGGDAAPPAEAARRMSLPPGFRATLFAGEPDVVQPIAFTTDGRGRLWVVESFSYPKWLPAGQRGRDRVV